MTKATVERLIKHFSNLAKGDFNERDFFVEIPAKRPGEEAGRMSLGKMSPQRRELIVSDAKRHLQEIKDKALSVHKVTGIPRCDYRDLFNEPEKKQAKESK